MHTQIEFVVADTHWNAQRASQFNVPANRVRNSELLNAHQH
jgi:hypothetical protein